MPQTEPSSRAEALELLRSIGAPVRLFVHGEIVSEVAGEISSALSRLGVRVNATLVAVGAALHDSGKIVHPEELEGPGRQHEAAGERLLLDHGLSPSLARFCRTHGEWEQNNVSFEERLVALADHVWKGTREERLELLVTDEAAQRLGMDRWHAFVRLDAEFEKIAADAPVRLAKARSV